MRGSHRRPASGCQPPEPPSGRHFLSGLSGCVETDDGATVFFDLRGYGRAYPPARRQIVAFAFRLSHDERNRRLKDVVCSCEGEVRVGDDRTVLVLDVAELVWEPLPERGLRSSE